MAAALIEYDSGITGACNAFFQVNGSKAPAYLFSVGASAAGVGAAAANGFFDVGKFTVSAPSTSIAIGIIKVLGGSKAYYIPCYPDTAIA